MALDKRATGVLRFRGIANKEGIFSVRDARHSMAGHFLQMCTKEMLLGGQIVIMVLIWLREGLTWQENS